MADLHQDIVEKVYEQFSQIMNLTEGVDHSPEGSLIHALAALGVSGSSPSVWSVQCGDDIDASKFLALTISPIFCGMLPHT